jgi:CheY-like chemotaxis protein
VPKAIHKILIVEDDKLMQEVLVTRFSREPFEVYMANDGQDGLQKALKYMPDLIMSDIKMPVMDGLAMMQELRKVEETKNIPIIFLTNFDTDESILKIISEDKPSFYLLKAETGLDDMVKKVKQSLGI